MDRINVVTRCSRFDLVPRVRASVVPPPGLPVTWWVLVDVRDRPEVPAHVLDLAREPWVELRFFSSRPGDMGHSFLNVAYGWMRGWVYNLDDDNLLHDRFYPAMRSELAGMSGGALVFDQYVGWRDFSGLEVRRAAPGDVRVGGIDFGQAVLHTDLIEGVELVPDYYCADGQFLSDLYRKAPWDFRFLNEVLCHYNALAG